MSKLISDAFDEAIAFATRHPVEPVLLLLDEADALASSRDSTQMHHEDRAGLNTLIQRLDNLRLNDLRLAAFLLPTAPVLLIPRSKGEPPSSFDLRGRLMTHEVASSPTASPNLTFQYFSLTNSSIKPARTDRVMTASRLPPLTSPTVYLAVHFARLTQTINRSHSRVSVQPPYPLDPRPLSARRRKHATNRRQSHRTSRGVYLS